MPNRFQIAQHQLAYDFIIKRDGEYCLVCFIENGIKRGPPTIKLQIDHADNNPRNWSSTNLHLLCQKHNLKMRNKPLVEHKRLIEDYSAKNECVRARENHYIATMIAKEQVDYASGSPEMQANSIYEQRWLDFMHEWIGVNGSIPRYEAIYSGSAAVDCSPSTTTRYLAKYSSSFGCFQESRDSAGVKIIVYRPINFKKK